MIAINNYHRSSEVGKTEDSPEQTTGTISISVLPQDKGQYVCQMSSSLDDRSTDDIRCYGQTKEHAIAIALEQLADDYRSYIESVIGDYLQRKDKTL